MSIQITLRRDKEFSPFRKQLLEICSIPGHGDLVLCSGYIWESTGYSVLDDDLLRAMRSGLAGNQIICVAGKLAITPVNWVQHYKDFVAKLRAQGIKVTAYIAPKRNWHAKIAVRLDKAGQPIVAMVGSSNLTGPAYGENRYSWNYECDVTLWRDKRKWDASLSQGRVPPSDPYTLIAAIPDPEIPTQPSVADRLVVLVEDIFRERDSFVHLSDYNGEA
jgi:hypothetical protein